MVDLAAGSHLAVLDLDKVPNMGGRAERGARPQAREGPDTAILADDGLLDDAVGMDLGVGGNVRIAYHAIRSDSDARAQVDVAEQHRVDVDEHIAAHGHVSANVDP